MIRTDLRRQTKKRSGNLLYDESSIFDQTREELSAQSPVIHPGDIYSLHCFCAIRGCFSLIVNAQPEKRAVPSDRSILEAASATKAETHSDDSDGQSAPTGTQTQNPPAHHSHHVRNFIIIFALGAALLIGLAAAAK